MYLSELFVEYKDLNIEIDLDKESSLDDVYRFELSGAIAYDETKKSVEVWICYPDIERLIKLFQTAKSIIDSNNND